MNELDCCQTRPLLVEYSDGELPSEQAGAIDRHLKGCPECRAQLERLKASLTFAKEIWAEPVEGLLAPMPERRPSSRRGRIALTAAAAAALLLALFAWQHFAKDHSPLAVEEPPPGSIPKEDSAIAPIPEDAGARSEEDLLAWIDRTERCARLRTSVGILECSPSLSAYAEDARHYLATTYGDLPPSNPVKENPANSQEESL